MIISYDLAGKLGLLNNNTSLLKTVAAGIGGTVPAILTVIDTVQAGKALDEFIPTIITSSLSSEFDGLIGMDFMSNYSIKIDPRKHVLVFEEIPESALMPGGHNEEWWRINFHLFASARSEWEKFRKDIDNKLKGPGRNSTTIEETNKLKELKEFAELQYREADALFNKLNKYAAEHAVPMHWREY